MVYQFGLISEERYQQFITKKTAIAREMERLQTTTASAKDETLQNLLTKRSSSPLKQGIPLAELLKRPQITYNDLLSLGLGDNTLPTAVAEQVEIQIKYDGYIQKQLEQVARMAKIENRLLPDEIDYQAVHGLRNEAKQKLNAVKPNSVGQASRISGVSPADISVLLVYLEQKRRQKENIHG